MEALSLVSYVVIISLGSIILLASLFHLCNLSLENNCLRYKVARMKREKAMLEKCTRDWVARDQLALAVNLQEDDLKPFLGSQKEQKVESISWLVFWTSSPTTIREDISQLVSILDKEIYEPEIPDRVEKIESPV